MSQPATGAGHERTDANVKAVAIAGVGLALLCAASVFAMYVIFRALATSADRRDAPLHPLAHDEPPPPPRLQTSPSRELAEFRARQEALANGYAWIDKQGGLVRIPLARALELVESEGLPVREQGGH